MKAKTIKPTILSRKPWGRLDEETKIKIVSEVNNGLLGERGAGWKYGLPKSTIGKWRDKHNLVNLLSPKTQGGLLVMNESKDSKLLKKKIEELPRRLRMPN
ncbi:hypothetical protein [Pedobacter sp.]